MNPNQNKCTLDQLLEHAGYPNLSKTGKQGFAPSA